MSDTQTAALGVLTGTADVLAAQGWTQQGGYEYKPGQKPADCALDLGSAIAKAAGVDIISRAADAPVGVHADAVRLLAAHVLPVAEPSVIPVRRRLDALIAWQDEPARTAGQVIAAVRGAVSAASGEPGGPFYPQHGSPVPDRYGYLVAECGHSVAESEWRAGFRTCERCMSSEWAEDETEDEAAAPAVVELAAAILDALNPPAAVTVSASAIAKRTDLIETRAAVVTGALRSLATDPDTGDLDDDVRTTVGAIRRVVQEHPVTYPTPQEKLPKSWTDRDGWVWDLTRAYVDGRSREWRFTGAWQVHRADGYREPSFGCKDVNESDWPVSDLVRSFELCRRAVCSACGEPIGEVSRDAWMHDDWEIEGHKASPVVRGGGAE